jgi:magnesium transporter
MDVWFLPAKGVEQRSPDDLPALLDRSYGFVWLDIPDPNDEAVQVLTKVFKFHYQAVHDCVERNLVPKDGRSGQYDDPVPA